MNPADLVIIGGGPAGIAAATAAATHGASVVLIEENLSLGGKVLSHNDQSFSGFRAEAIEARTRRRMLKAFQRVSGRMAVYTGAQAWHSEKYSDDGREVYLQTVAGPAGAVPPSVRGRALVIAAGAMERMIPLAIKDADIAAVISPLSFNRIFPHIYDLISGIGLYKFLSIVNYLFTLQRLRIPVHSSVTLVEALGCDALDQAVIARADASGREVPESRRFRCRRRVGRSRLFRGNYRRKHCGNRGLCPYRNREPGKSRCDDSSPCRPVETDEPVRQCPGCLVFARSGNGFGDSGSHGDLSL